MVASQKKINSMRIGIDARLYNEKGLGRYIRNLISNLQKLDKENQYFVFLLNEDFKKLKFNNNFTKVLADFRWYTVKEQTNFPKILNQYNLDLLHVPHFNVPIFYKGKMVVTIHDLIHQHVDTRSASTHNFLIHKIKKLGYKKVFGTALKRSSNIITVSEFVKKQLEDEWKVDHKKITVTYEGVDESFGNIASKGILKEKGIKPPYIFYIGNAHPHKNIKELIKAFIELRKKYQYLQLVLAGDDNFFWPKIRKFVMDSRIRGNEGKPSSASRNDNIVFTGKVSDEELVTLYKNAQCFVTASLEEGFGLPLLEAFALNCPVVSSNMGSLPEVGNNAALYFDPKDQEDMMEKIRQVLNNQKTRNELIKKGKKRVKDFSWEKMTKETLKIYQST